LSAGDEQHPVPGSHPSSLPRGCHTEKSCKQTDPQLIGFAATPGREPVSKPPSRNVRSAVCSIPFKVSSSSFSAQLLLGAPSRIHLAGDLSIPASPRPWVSFPLRDITRARRHKRSELPAHRFAPSSGFRSLPTVYSAPELAGLFHPAATFRDPLVQGPSLPAQPPFLVGRSMPPGRWDTTALRPKRLAPFRSASACDASRLRGFHLHEAAFRKSGYSPRSRPLPSSSFCSSRSSFSRRRLRFTQNLPLMTFVAFSVLSSREIG